MAKLTFDEKDLKTERVAVLMTPTRKMNLIKIASVQRVSVNTVINNAIAEYVKNHHGDIERFDAFFGEE
ncbi:MAG: hypothetical protein IKW20_05830 [Bacteroidales bacterium]|nr:hypothetical protein [Bacteroidales bacterium]